VTEKCSICGKPISDEEYVVNWTSCADCFDAGYERFLSGIGEPTMTQEQTEQTEIDPEGSNLPQCDDDSVHIIDEDEEDDDDMVEIEEEEEKDDEDE